MRIFAQSMLSAIGLALAVGGMSPSPAQDRGVAVESRAATQQIQSATHAPVAQQAVTAPAAAAPAGNHAASLPQATPGSAAFPVTQPVPIAVARPVSQDPTFIVYEFSADWCPSCQVLKPFVERVAAAYASRIKFVPVNIDEPASKPLQRKMRITAIPAIVIYDPVKKDMRYMVGLQQGMQFDRILQESLQERSHPVTQ